MSPLAPATVVMTPTSRAVDAGKAAGLDGKHGPVDAAEAATVGDAVDAATVGDAVGAVTVGDAAETACVGEMVGRALTEVPQLVSTAALAAKPTILTSRPACPMPV